MLKASQPVENRSQTPWPKLGLKPLNPGASTNPNNMQTTTTRADECQWEAGDPLLAQKLEVSTTRSRWFGVGGPYLLPSSRSSSWAPGPRPPTSMAGLASRPTMGLQPAPTAGGPHSLSELALQGDGFRARLCPSAFRTNSRFINSPLLCRQK